MKTIQNVFFFLLIYSINVLAQQFTAGIGPGMSLILGDNFYTQNLGYSGYYNVNGDHAAFQGMNFSSEFNFSTFISYALEESPLTFYSQFSFLMLRGSGNASIVPDPYKQELYENFNITTKLDIFTADLGCRYYIYYPNLKPFIFLEAGLNNFGNITFDAENINYNLEFASTKGFERTGIAAGAGLDYFLYSFIDLEIIIKYSDYNFFYRRVGEANLRSVSFGMMFCFR